MQGREITPVPLSDMIATLSNKKKNRLPKILEHASGDKRFKILEAHMKKHQFKQDALIEVLHKAQELFGFLEDDLLLFIAYRLKLPASRVYGVATFYHFFTLKPNGKHTCVVCMGTACYVKGADKVLARPRRTASFRCSRPAASARAGSRRRWFTMARSPHGRRPSRCSKK
jgi:bidirectional [NiFe] hydrogenase diaphorase subunit